jgi:hypothetical protein
MSFLAGLSPDLLWASAWVFLFGLGVASRDLPFRYALPVVGIKILIPVVYFAHNPTGALHLSDDVGYFNNGIALLQMGLNPVSLFADPRGLPALMSVAGGAHVAYPLWNLLGMSLFGPHYFSPVLLNVGLTFVSGWIFFRMLRDANFSVAYSRFALAFFLLHWDTLAWSSFLNLKDTLAVTLAMALLWQFSALLRRPRLRRALPIAILAAASVFVRFYIPVLVLSAVLVDFAFRKKDWRLSVLLAASVAAFAWGSDLVLGALVRVYPGHLWWGVPQFLLTPLPWNLSVGYEFLLIPSILHLLLIVPAALAASSLWSRSREARFILIYFLVVIFVFSVIPENRGIRQRQMVSFVFAWMQFHALAAFARYALDPDGGHSATGPASESRASIP